MVKEENINYNCYDQLLDLYLPDDIIKSVFVYFHAGGFEGGSKNEATAFAQLLTDNGIAVVSASYRKYPKAKFPEFIEDSADAVAWVFNNKDKFKGCDNIFVGGSSAGGYISMLLCFDDRYLSKHNIKPTDITGYIHDSGQPTSHFNVLREKGMDTKRVIVDETAPLFYVGLAEKYSPMLFLVADNDLKSRYEQTLLTLSTLEHYGHNCAQLKVMHGGHISHLRNNNEDGENLLGKEILEFINNTTAN